MAAFKDMILFQQELSVHIAKQPRENVYIIVFMLSHIQLFVTRWTAAFQAPLSMEFSKLE